MLNPSSPLPLYQQLAEQLTERIEAGAFAAGGRLPSEPELSRAHRIGRPTVRQATELLVQRGLIERRRGSGTYVRAAPRRVDLFSLAGTFASFQRGGLELETKQLGRVTRKVVASDAENPFSEREAFTFSRLGSIERRPVLLEHLYLEPDVFPGFTQLRLAGASLSRLVEERYHLKPSHAEQSFRVAMPSHEIAAAIKAPRTSALLLVRRTLFFPRAPRAVYAEIYCRTDDLVFSQTIGAEVRLD
jgi:GntR family transcriptional regulator